MELISITVTWSRQLKLAIEFPSVLRLPLSNARVPLYIMLRTPVYFGMSKVRVQSRESKAKRLVGNGRRVVDGGFPQPIE